MIWFLNGISFVKVENIARYAEYFLLHYLYQRVPRYRVAEPAQIEGIPPVDNEVHAKSRARGSVALATEVQQSPSKSVSRQLHSGLDPW